MPISSADWAEVGRGIAYPFGKLANVTGNIANFVGSTLAGQPYNPSGQSASNRPRIGSLPPDARQIMQYPEGVSTGLGGGNAGAYIPPTRGQAPAAGAGPAGVSPNTIVQSSDDTYNQLLSQYGAEGVSKLANMSALPTNFSPTAGAKPASLSQYYAAQTMQGNAGLGEIVNKMGYSGDMAKWAKANPALAQRAYANKFGTAPGGGEGMYNPQMQAHGDVPSMAELWKGIGGGAPTTGPSQDAIKAAMARGINQPGSGGFYAPFGSPNPTEPTTGPSQDAIKAAMARGINQPGSGGFYAPSGSPNPTAGFDQSANPAAASLQQQMDTAKQANSGTEATTTLQKTNDFLRDLNLGNLNFGSYNFPSFDYGTTTKNMVNNRNDYSSYFGGPQ